MKTLAPLLVAAATLLAAAAPASSRTSTPQAAASCGTGTVGGATVITHCGPAKATFTFGGKTYRVSGGTCVVSKLLGPPTWALSVGRQTLPPDKPKFADFNAISSGKPKAGTFSKLEYTISFAVPGAGWALSFSQPHKITVTAGAKRGSFTGRFYTGSRRGTKPAHGFWTC